MVVHPELMELIQNTVHGGRVPAAVDSCAPQLNGLLPGGQVLAEAAADGDSGDTAAGGMPVWWFTRT